MRTLAVGLVLALGWARSAEACLCAGLDATKALKDPELQVFTGRAAGYLETRWFSLALIEVDRVWSGDLSRHVVLNVQVTSCGHPDVWTPGAEHLFVTVPGTFGHTTSGCLGNEPLASAGPTLARLGPARRPRGYAAVLTPLLLLVCGGLAAVVRRSRRRGAAQVQPR